MRKSSMKFLILVTGMFLLAGCAGTRAFHEVARAGDTVAVAAGWKHHFGRDNITVTITPSSGPSIVYLPNDPAVKAVTNLYPDPLSSLIVSPQAKLDMTPWAQYYGGLVQGSITYGDNDWWQTAVFVNLPVFLSVGLARIEITNPQGEYTYSDVEIVSGTGRPNTFSYTQGTINTDQLASMERVGNYVIQFSGSTIPYAIQMDLMHDPDVDHGGAGRAHVVNTRGDMKNAVWRDDGSNLRIILSPAKDAVLSRISDFKVYVTGGITGLQLLNLKATDIDGNPVTGISGNVSWND